MRANLILVTVSALICYSSGQWLDNCPRQVTWSLEDSTTNRSCILMTGTYQFMVPYVRSTNDVLANATATVPVAQNATVTGSCGSASSLVEQITLTWPVPEDTSESNVSVPMSHTVTFVFTKNSTSKSDANGYFCLQRVTATLRSNPTEFPSDVEPAKVYTIQGDKLAVMSTPLGLSYFCSSSQDLPLGTSGGKLRLEHTQFEVFHKTPLKNDGDDFSSRSYCFNDGLRMLITAVVLISILIGAGAFTIFLCRRQVNKKSKYTSLD